MGTEILFGFACRWLTVVSEAASTSPACSEPLIVICGWELVNGLLQGRRVGRGGSGGGLPRFQPGFLAARPWTGLMSSFRGPFSCGFSSASATPSLSPCLPSCPDPVTEPFGRCSLCLECSSSPSPDPLGLPIVTFSGRVSLASLPCPQITEQFFHSTCRT